MFETIKKKLSKLKPEKKLSYHIFKSKYKLFIKHLIIWLLLFILFISILTWFFEQPTNITEFWNKLIYIFGQMVQIFSMYFNIGLFFALPIAGVALYLHKYIADLNSLDYNQKIIKNLIPACIVTLPFYLGIFALYFFVFVRGYDVALSLGLGWIALLFVRSSHYFYPEIEKKIAEEIGYIIVPLGIVLSIIPLGKILKDPSPFLEQLPLIITFFVFLVFVTIALEMLLLYLALENLKNVKIQKIKNYKILVERFNSAHNDEQREDIKAEIEVGWHHVKKGHSIEYEPQKKSPDFCIDTDSLSFYTEVKRVNEPDEFIRRKKVIRELNKRLKYKIKSPYNIILNFLDYDQQLLTDIRHVSRHIINIVENVDLIQNQQCQDININVNGRHYGSMIVYIPGKKTRKHRVLFDEPVWSDLASRIRNQIKYANLKALPKDAPYFVVVKLPDFVDKETAKEAIFGSEKIRCYWRKGQLNPTYYLEKRIVDKIFNNPKHYKKISAVIYYYKEFKAENTMYEINQNANFKINRQDIIEFYFRCKSLQ